MTISSNIIKAWINQIYAHTERKPQLLFAYIHTYTLHIHISWQTCWCTRILRHRYDSQSDYNVSKRTQRSTYKWVGDWGGKKKANNIKITEIINFTNTAVLCVGKYAKITLLIWSGWSFSWCVCWHWMTTELSLLENSIPDIIYYYLLQNIPVCLYVTICVKALQLHNIYTSNEYVMQRCKDIIHFFYWF